MMLIFGINNSSCLLFLLIHTCWLLAIIVSARSRDHHNHNHHSHPHHDGDDHRSKSHRSKRITGSLPASPERWKFMALLKIPKNKERAYYCSAILINNRSLLTAAHCLDEYDPSTLPLELLFKGKSFRTVDLRKDHGVLHKTKSFKIYEEYWDHTDDWIEQEPYDIAIVKLEKPLVLDPKRGIDRVDLPIGQDGRKYPFDPYNCYLLGYGKETPTYPDHRLQQVKVPVLPRRNCKLHAVDIERQICFGYPWKPSKIPAKAGADGDSGGAFMCKTIHFHTGYGKHRKPPKYVLIAMHTIEDNGDESQEKLSIGIRITQYMDWIQRNS